MSKEFKILKCKKCEAMVEVLKDCNCKNCGIQCCGDSMKELIPNSVDAAVEKHVPNYEVNDEKIIIKVNHVMEEEHFIEWISIVYDGNIVKKYLKPGEEAILQDKYVPGSTIYAYCNKHGLWKADVK